jgi:pimeloyl-ACP methyl ester carboxylesterase
LSAAESTGPCVIDVQGIPITYEVRGEGDPVVMIHGWSADRRYMLADLESVFVASPGWRRVYLDLPGHGATPAPSWLSTQDQVLTIVAGFIEAVVPSGRFAIVGSSWGGHVALGIIRTMADRILGAALLVPDVPRPDGSRTVEEPVVLIEDGSVFGSLAPDEEWIPGDLVVHEKRMIDEIREHEMPAYRIADYAFLERLEAHYLPTGVAARPGSGITQPSLIITGRQDARVGFRAAWDLLDEFPRATYAVLDMAGHWPGRVERPEVFRALVADWLERMRMQPSVRD